MEPVAVDEVAAHRLVYADGGVEAELVYRLNGRRLVLVHTEVPEALGGRGIGGKLVRAAVDKARTDAITLVPLCPFARHWLETHPDEVAGVEIDWAQPAT